jgi:transposase-like protein
VKHESWIKEVVSAFLAGETLRSLCKRLGGSPNTIRQVLKDNLGEEKFEAIRDRNDPKKSIATEAEILTSFHTDEPFKEIAARLNMSPNTLRNRWITAFGKEAFDARSKRFHSEAGIRAGFARKGKKYLSEETIRAREVSRGVDRRCPVCNVGCVGYQALTHHMVRIGDGVHINALQKIRTQANDDKWIDLQEGIDYVVCSVCGIKSALLNNHIKLHDLTAFEYQVKYPGAMLTPQQSELKRREALIPFYQDFTLNLTVKDLIPFIDEKGAVIPLKAAKSLNVARSTILQYCRKLGLPTRNKLSWQRYVLDSASDVYGDYEWEWSDPRIINPETGWAFRYDGFFSKHNVIVEAHGDQHYRYSEAWHGSLKNFHFLRERDKFKKESAEKLGYRCIIVRPSDPVHDSNFWKRQLEINDEERKLCLDLSINQVFNNLRREEFPKIIADEVELKKAVTRLRSIITYIDDRFLVRPYSTTGTAACASFFPERYHAKHFGAKSVWDAWHNDKDLKKAIKLQLESGHPTSPLRVLRALVFFHRTPSVFRPVVAKYIYQKYSNQGVVWDPCMGYGSRLLAAMVVGVKRYIGTDIEQSTVSGNLAIAKCLGILDHCSLFCKKAEEFDPKEELDLVFTSPSYFNLESYGPDSISEVLYGSSKGWVDNFLTPLLAISHLRLKKEGYLLLNLPSKPVMGTRLDLEANRIAKSMGFIVKENFWLPVRRFKGTLKGEPILVWQK